MRLLKASIIISLLTTNVCTAMTAKVVKIEFGPHYGDIIHIDLAGNNPTNCANNGAGFDYSFDGSTKTGEKIFSALLAAQKSDSTITVRGMGICSLNSNTEDIRWLQSH